MGLLDDLEQEAQRQREEDAQQAALREQRERVWHESLEPSMQRLFAYLKQLTEKLSFLKRKIKLAYPIHGYGDVVANIEPNFILRTETPRDTYEIILEYLAHVATEECAVQVADSIARVRALSSVLQQHSLGGMGDARKNPNGDVVAARFQARGKISMSMTITATVDSGVAKFVFNNLEGFGQSTRSFTPDQLNDSLFDALGRFMTRDDLHFAQEALSDDVRRSLQLKIQRDHKRREWEQKLARQLADDEAKVVASLDPAARPGWLLGRLRLLSVRLFGR